MTINRRFLAPLSRFMSRKGQCAHFCSYNGSNIVGEYHVLKTYFKTVVKQKNVHDFLTIRDINWHFIPPIAPHFSGLQKRAVISAIKQLLSVSKGVLLTFDETRTLLCKVEAVLNFEPLSSFYSVSTISILFYLIFYYLFHDV